MNSFFYCRVLSEQLRQYFGQIELNQPQQLPEQVWQIVSIISDLGWLANTIFISFEMGNLVDLREKYPDQPVQFLTDTYSDALIDELAEKQMDLDIEYTELTEDRIAHIHEKGLKVNCWTNDDPTCAQNLVSWGIDYITSNILE